MRQVLFFAVVSLTFSGCASWAKFTSGDGEVVYGTDAEDNIKRGKEALDSKNYPEAQRYFEYVKTKYTFLDAAKEAELLLADTDFERDRFIEARDRYTNFVRLHPTHPKIDYAAWRAALTHYKDMPSDFFLLPPSAEKDQVELRSALTAIAEFMRNFPASTYLPEAQKVLDEVKRKLADHELYVAEFYAKRDRWLAVVGRLNNLVKNYSGIGYDERASFGLFDAYRNLRDDAKARDALEKYIAKFPESEGAKRAKHVLEVMVSRPAPEAVKPESKPEPVAAPDAGA